MKIYATFGNGQTVELGKVTKREAEARIARYEREDRYEHEVEKYPFPPHYCGKYPVYTVR